MNKGVATPTVVTFNRHVVDLQPIQNGIRLFVLPPILGGILFDYLFGLVCVKSMGQKKTLNAYS